MRGDTRRLGGKSAILVVTLLITALPTAWAGSDFAWTTTARTTSRSTCSPTGDVTTGGGWLFPDGRSKRIFALSAELGTVPPLGRLLFINHISHERLKGEIVTYVVTPIDTRLMTGTGTANGEEASFELEVSDAAEPGRQDTFDLRYTTPLGGTRFEPGPLGGGNIQIRPMCDVT
jgi:hypothetical protein